jgi:RimJ/RimL family protein N-acetyltransferase
MIRQGKIVLRDRRESDVAVLHRELHDDVPLHARADGRPWMPVGALGPKAPYAPPPPDGETAVFSVDEAGSGELAGSALLWSVDTHHRSAHLGVGLRPAFRGRGLGKDIVRGLCLYGFTVRGLHRLQVDTLSDNAAMIAAARASGFAVEGMFRKSRWSYGTWADEVVLSLLAEDWPGA